MGYHANRASNKIVCTTSEIEGEVGVKIPWPEYLSCRFGYENISTAILPFPLIQEDQFSVNGERMYAK